MGGVEEVVEEVDEGVGRLKEGSVVCRCGEGLQYMGMVLRAS